MDEVPFADNPIVAAILAHRRDANAVPKGDRSQRQWFEQVCGSHALFIAVGGVEAIGAWVQPGSRTGGLTPRRSPIKNWRLHSIASLLVDKFVVDVNLKNRWAQACQDLRPNFIDADAMFFLGSNV